LGNGLFRQILKAAPFLLNNGHSIHDERPVLLASQIDSFIHTFTIGTVDHATFEYTTDDDIHLVGKIDGGSTVKLVSNRGSIVIDGKIDGGSKVELSAAGDVVIGVLGADGDKKIDGGCVVSVVSGGFVRLGNKIDNGATVVSFHARTGIDIGDKIDGGAKVRLRTDTGRIHVHGKIDNGSTRVLVRSAHRKGARLALLEIHSLLKLNDLSFNRGPAQSMDT
jgi:hypothetical protein